MGARITVDLTEHDSEPELIEPGWITELDGHMPEDPLSADRLIHLAVEHLDPDDWIRREEEGLTSYSVELETGYLVLSRTSDALGDIFSGRVIFQNWEGFILDYSVVDQDMPEPLVYPISPELAESIFAKLEGERIAAERMNAALADLTNLTSWVESCSTDEDEESIVTSYDCYDQGITFSAEEREFNGGLREYSVTCSYHPDAEPETITGQVAKRLFSNLKIMFLQKELIEGEIEKFHLLGWEKMVIEGREHFFLKKPFDREDPYLGLRLKDDNSCEVVKLEDGETSLLFEDPSLVTAYKELELQYAVQSKHALGQLINRVRDFVLNDTPYRCAPFTTPESKGIVIRFTTREARAFSIGYQTNQLGTYYFLKFEPTKKELESGVYTEDLLAKGAVVARVDSLAETVDTLIEQAKGGYQG
ncbi:MAG: hypothetical protein H6619_04285 [Deltaproteobacteria bacterium]|nr:hypothetical protein [Deltaproteobacteria bacterium]